MSFRTPYPNAPKILFIGPAESSHTHSWIGLLDGAEFNVRLFGTSSVPPPEWAVPTYVTRYLRHTNPANRALLYPTNPLLRGLKKAARLARHESEEQAAKNWLSQIIREWQPHIVHTFGLDSAKYYFGAHRESRAIWVAQLRGGSDLQLSHHDPAQIPQIVEVLSAADQIVSDNRANFRYLTEMGIAAQKFASIAPVPGSGGIDIAAFAPAREIPTSQRRVILYPKAYNSAWSLALPVLEALRLCWDAIQPCEIHITAMSPDVYMWYWTLPEAIRRCCHVEQKRIARADLLALMGRTRVMLAPSLVDGVPNTMYEAMACGALPLLSPLETITPLVEDGKNLLFARNLYPQEIADALTRAMTDDALVDNAARLNLPLVSEIADRAQIAPRIIAYYQGLVR
jgi:glycosyltransferase involved in cell wall biosynthesis